MIKKIQDMSISSSSDAEESSRNSSDRKAKPNIFELNHKKKIEKIVTKTHIDVIEEIDEEHDNTPSVANSITREFG